MSTINYAAEKLSEAMDVLAKHPGDIRGRLTAVYPVLLLVPAETPPE